MQKKDLQCNLELTRSTSVERCRTVCQGTLNVLRAVPQMSGWVAVILLHLPQWAADIFLAINSRAAPLLGCQELLSILGICMRFGQLWQRCFSANTSSTIWLLSSRACASCADKRSQRSRAATRASAGAESSRI